MPSTIDTVIAATARGMAARPRVGGFPYLAEALRSAGVRRYFFDVPSASVVYVTDAGDVLQPGSPAGAAPTGEMVVVPSFDAGRLIAAIRADQAGESAFPEFVAATLASGVLRYEVDTDARTCTYLGLHGESYVEEYPAVTLPSAPSVD